MNAPSPLHRPSPHESGLHHATGEALYVDDLPAPKGLLVAQIVCSPVAHGLLREVDVAAARALPGIRAVLTARDIPGVNDIAPSAHDEPLLATDRVHTVGQAVALVVGDSYAECRAAAAVVKMTIEELPAILSLRAAIGQNAFLTQPHTIRRGDIDAALAKAPIVLSGELESGGQDHFYLETQCALALPEEGGTLKIFSSTQHPTEVQAKVAEVMRMSRHAVVVEVPRMGGGFGGKETQAAHFAALAALGAKATRRPVKVWLNRDQDMTQTGKRHPFLSYYEAGFDREGRISALRVKTFADGGWSADLSSAILDRCLFHLDNGYFLEHAHLEGRVCRTHTLSNTAFRGFGGPQGMLVIETIMSRIAARLGVDSAEIRRRNFYDASPRDRTPYGMEVKECRLPRMHGELLRTSEYESRRTTIAEFNQKSRFTKRGIAFAPVKFGISFTNSLLNQAGALVLIYSDGTVQLNHGGTEMGQGLHTKMLAVAAHELGVPSDRIRVMPTATDKVPNTSATAASSGSDLNGQAVKQACEILRARLSAVASELLGRADPGEMVFASGSVHPVGQPALRLSFDEVVYAAWLRRVSLSATGYYATPNIHYDRTKGQGKPFHYFAYGAAVIEVEVNGLTGEHRLRRVDILHDVGDSLVPSVDRGQIEGAFVQGWGWLTCEELVLDGKGHLKTHSPDTYKIPAVSDAPIDFRVSLLERATQPDVIHGSKAVGEPPLMLAIGVVEALASAVRAFGPEPGAQGFSEVNLRIPCTPEAVLRAIHGK